MDPIQFAVWAVVWFVVGRISGRFVLPSLVDIVHDLRPGRGT